MLCEKCGKEVNENQKYCAQCEAYENSSKVKGILSVALAGASIAGILPLIGAVVGIVLGVMSKGTKGEKLGQAGIIVGIIGIAIAAVEFIGASIAGIGTAIVVVIYFMVVMGMMGFYGEMYY